MDPQPEYLRTAFGVTWQYILLRALSSVSSVCEALELVSSGDTGISESYGKKNALRTRHNNYIMLDKKEAAVVEVTANRYAIRRPGDNGEDPGYVVATNHFVATTATMLTMRRRTSLRPLRRRRLCSSERHSLLHSILAGKDEL